MFSPALTMNFSVLDVFAARRRLADRVRRTPLVPSSWLSAAAGASVHLKLESLQITNSFKARGAFNALLRLGERSGGGARPVVTASAGNHGRALAYAAEQLGIPAIVFTPRDAARTKREAIARHGADLRAEAVSYEDAERRAKEFAASGRATFLSPYSHPDILAGTGTIALEILEDLPGVEAVVVPIGGGGLIGGIAATLKTIAPHVEVIGVEAEASPAFHVALREGRIVEVAVKPTLADGLAGNMDPDTITFALVQKHVDRVVLVSEDQLAEGIRGLVANERLIAEGAGIAGVAAVLAGRGETGRRATVIVVSGSNIDLERLSTVLAAGPA